MADQRHGRWQPRLIGAAAGILLTFYYVPQPMHAYESVRQITFSVRFGWLVRGLHQASAQLMVVAVLLHMIRVLSRAATVVLASLRGWLAWRCFWRRLASPSQAMRSYTTSSPTATTVGTNMIAEVPKKILDGVPVVPKANPSGPNPPLAMPSYRGIVGVEEMRQLVDYLFSLKPPGESSPF